MEDDSKKKLIVIAILLIFAVLTAIWLVLLFIVGLPTVIAVIYAVIELLIMAVLIYCGIQRIHEIDEGMDNDIDNY